MHCKSSMDVSTMWKRVFPRPHPTLQLAPFPCKGCITRLSSPSNFSCCFPGPLGVVRIHSCGFAAAVILIWTMSLKEMSRARGAPNKPETKKTTEPLGSSGLSWGPCFQQATPFQETSPPFLPYSPASISGLEMNSSVHAIIAAIRILSHTRSLY